MVWACVALLAPVWWTARAMLGTRAVAEPREELALAVDEAWRAEFGSRLPWVSGTRALAASVAFYAASHPRTWSLWNQSVETPWSDSGTVMSQGGVIVCEPGDEPCHTLAETWSAARQRVSVAKSVRGFDFPARSYDLYWLVPVNAGPSP